MGELIARQRSIIVQMFAFESCASHAVNAALHRVSSSAFIVSVSAWRAVWLIAASSG
jgi:hypothetical protein